MGNQQKFTFLTLARALERVREIDSTMTTQQLSVLLLIAAHGEAPMADVAAKADMERSSVSRNMAILGPYGRQGKKGLGLLSFREDLTNRSRKFVKLTPKGKALVDELADIVAQGLKLDQKESA